jgi:hypothetical protein
MRGWSRIVIGTLVITGWLIGCTTTKRQAALSAPDVSQAPVAEASAAATMIASEPMFVSFCPSCGAHYPSEVQYCPLDGAELKPSS